MMLLMKQKPKISRERLLEMLALTEQGPAVILMSADDCSTMIKMILANMENTNELH